VVLPQGALFRGGVEQRIRRHLLESDLVEAVVGLAPNLFYGATLPACVMVLRGRKQPERQGKVLIVDAARLFERGRNQNILGDKHRERIEELYKEFVAEDGLAHVADLGEIAQNNFDLNITRYITFDREEQRPSLAEATTALKSAVAQARDAEGQLSELLEAEGLNGQGKSGSG
jgi:type I restriction enzyme M protein